MEPIKTIDEVRKAIDAFDNSSEELTLTISDELQDPVGLNMAIIGDYLLAHRWEPNGFEQKEGYRIYRYKSFN